MKAYIFLLLIFLFILFSSCEKPGQHASFFQQVEELIPIHPDSALIRLMQVKDLNNFKDGDKAYFYLLLTEAQDKNYVEHSTDSLITIAANYYEKTNDVERKAKTWYYKGRINQDLQQPLKAQEYYLKALREEEQIRDYALLGRVNNYIGILYTYQEVYEKAVPYLRKAHMYFQSLNDTIGQTYVLRDLGRAFDCIGQKDSAILSYEQALPYAQQSKAITIASELGSLYFEKGENEKAYDAISMVFAWTTDEKKLYPVYFTLGMYYRKVDQLDSAIYFLERSLSSSSLLTRAGATEQLALIKKSQKDWKNAVCFFDRCKILRDSINQITMAESIRKTDEFYKNQELNQSLYQKELALIQRDKERYLYTFILCIIVFVSVWLYGRWKKTRMSFLVHEKELEHTIEKQHQRNNEQKEANDQRIALLEKDLAIIKEEKDLQLKFVSLQLEKQRLEMCNAAIEDAEGRHSISISIFQQSDIYLKLHENRELLKIQSTDWENLEEALNDTYDNFAVRLKRLYPAMSLVEMKACMLTKIDLPASRISKLLYNSSVLRVRLYKKIFKKEGSVDDFVKFIKSF